MGMESWICGVSDVHGTVFSIDALTMTIYYCFYHYNNFSFCAAAALSSLVSSSSMSSLLIIQQYTGISFAALLTIYIPVCLGMPTELLSQQCINRVALHASRASPERHQGLPTLTVNGNIIVTHIALHASRLHPKSPTRGCQQHDHHCR